MGKKKFGNQKETKRKECKISSDREGKKSSHPSKNTKSNYAYYKTWEYYKTFFLCYFVAGYCNNMRDYD